MAAASVADRRAIAAQRAAPAYVVAKAISAAIGAALIEWRKPIEEGEVGTDAIIVEFQPEQIQTEPTPQPVEKVEVKEEPLPEQQSEAMLAPKPEPPPEPPREEVPAVVAQPSRARAQAATWRSQIVTILERNKRFPSQAVEVSTMQPTAGKVAGS